MNVEYFSLPLAGSLSTAAGDITEREGFLVGVEAPPGLGEACPLPGWTESLAECRSALKSATTADLDSLPPAARHAVALALVDADARAAGVPLYRHLGRDTKVERVPINATVGDNDGETTAKQVAEAVGQGYETVKIKVGVRTLAADLERMRAVRRACPDVALRVDANGAWDRETAARAVDALADLGVEYVEQPLAAEDLAGHADLRGSDVGIALDEGLYEHGLDAALNAGAADAWVLKPMAMGGPDTALEAAVLARGAGVDPVVTTTVDGAVARTAAVHVAAAIPNVSACGLATGNLLAVDFEPDPAPVDAGNVRVPQKDGNTGASSPTDYA
jgi:o-succinylbenzoate synthase